MAVNRQNPKHYIVAVCKIIEHKRNKRKHPGRDINALPHQEQNKNKIRKAIVYVIIKLLLQTQT
jgi:hypothetical protein